MDSKNTIKKIVSFIIPPLGLYWCVKGEVFSRKRKNIYIAIFSVLLVCWIGGAVYSYIDNVVQGPQRTSEKVQDGLFREINEAQDTIDADDERGVLAEKYENYRLYRKSTKIEGDYAYFSYTNKSSGKNVNLNVKVNRRNNKIYKTTIQGKQADESGIFEYYAGLIMKYKPFGVYMDGPAYIQDVCMGESSGDDFVTTKGYEVSDKNDYVTKKVEYVYVKKK